MMVDWNQTRHGGSPPPRHPSALYSSSQPRSRECIPGAPDGGKGGAGRCPAPSPVSAAPASLPPSPLPAPRQGCGFGRVTRLGSVVSFGCERGNGVDAAIFADLVLRARGGDLQAFAVLAESEWPALFRTAWAVLGDAHEAEDAVQDALLRAFSLLGQLHDTEAFHPWLRRIAVNQAKNRLRAAARRRAREQADAGLYRVADALGADPGRVVEAGEGAERLLLAVRRLPRRERGRRRGGRRGAGADGPMRRPRRGAAGGLHGQGWRDSRGTTVRTAVGFAHGIGGRGLVRSGWSARRWSVRGAAVGSRRLEADLIGHVLVRRDRAGAGLRSPAGCGRACSRTEGRACGDQGRAFSAGPHAPGARAAMGAPRTRRGRRPGAGDATNRSVGRRPGARGARMEPAERSGTPCWVRVQLVREEGVAYRPRIGGPEDAAALLAELLAGEPRESFLALCLDSTGSTRYTASASGAWTTARRGRGRSSRRRY